MTVRVTHVNVAMSVEVMSLTVVNFMLVVYREYNDQLSWTMGIHVTGSSGRQVLHTKVCKYNGHCVGLWEYM